MAKFQCTKGHTEGFSPSGNCRVCSREANARYRARHKEQVAEYHKRYSAEHKEQINAKTLRWQKANRDKIRAYWRANADRKAGYDSARRFNASVGMDELDREMSRLFRQAIASDPCAYCGDPGEETDHVTPLVAGGTDHWYNLARSCTRCNRTKGAKSVAEFMNAGHPGRKKA